jgi:UDP-N-acetylmuramoyl-tripeptide--D-alanyl-D-alanine ligase
MRFLTSQVARAVGGTMVGPDVEVDGAGQDSRTLSRGALFVPIVAARDGHDFIEGALANGAAAYLSARGHRGGTAVLVDDTAASLARLGAAARARQTGQVVGITGSVGKTSTKDLAASVLGTTLATFASERSFNNEIGVPLTLCDAPEQTEAVVVEMGARGVGHVAALCAIARPTIGVVTAVGAAHLELFGSLDEVACAKGELVESLDADGTAVLNADDERVAAMATRTRARVVTFGARGEVRAEGLRLRHDLTSAFVLASPWGRVEVELAVRGEHNVTNALAAAVVGLVAGVSLDATAAGLRAAQLSPWRMELVRGATGVQILNDAYNANPVSMRAALRSLVALRARRHIAVLGPMAELGTHAAAAHRDVAALAAELGVRVIAVGTSAYGAEVARDADAALDALGAVDDGDAILVKGSRVAALEGLAGRLAANTG